MNVLISSAGRRIGLLQCFREALQEMGTSGTVCAADCSATAPSFHLADRVWLVPRCTDPLFVSSMQEIAVKGNIRLIVPTIDTELPIYAAAREEFAARGVAVCVSDERTVAICGNKTLTNRWLLEKGFPTVRQGSPKDVLNDPEQWHFPVIAKPRNGSASIGVRRICSCAELQFLAESDKEIVIEEIAIGKEYTVNVYVDREGRCRCAVPHERIEVRAGEVSKGVTVKNQRLMELARSIAEALPCAQGPLNIQCFVAPDGDTRVIEMNARFGGGYPLAQRAGAHFARWLIEETVGLQISASFDCWIDDLAMLRYDDAIYVRGTKIRQENYEAPVSGV